jgi:hypothetical protein
VKQCGPRVSTDAGIEIKFSDVHSVNASFSIALIVESHSNETVSSPVQQPKQISLRIWTEEGIQIDFRDSQPKNTPFAM